MVNAASYMCLGDLRLFVTRSILEGNNIMAVLPQDSANQRAFAFACLPLHYIVNQVGI